MLIDFFPMEKFFSTIFDFHFRENPRFHDETGKLETKEQSDMGLGKSEKGGK